MTKITYGRKSVNNKGITNLPIHDYIIIIIIMTIIIINKNNIILI